MGAWKSAADLVWLILHHHDTFEPVRLGSRASFGSLAASFFIYVIYAPDRASDFSLAVHFAPPSHPPAVHLRRTRRASGGGAVRHPARGRDGRRFCAVVRRGDARYNPTSWGRDTERSPSARSDHRHPGRRSGDRRARPAPRTAAGRR